MVVESVNGKGGSMMIHGGLHVTTGELIVQM
jgi:hypothetical protein